MRKSRFGEEKMVEILREADQVPVVQVSKKRGVSEQRIHDWWRHFGSMESADVKRSRQLAPENARLKKLLVDRDLEIDVMKEIVTKNGERVGPARRGPLRDGARPVTAEGLRAALGVALDGGYASTKVKKDVPVLAAMGPNQVWSYDFVHDACANGQKLKCLTVVNEFTRRSLAVDVAGSIRSGRVVEALSLLISVRRRAGATDVSRKFTI